MKPRTKRPSNTLPARNITLIHQKNLRSVANQLGAIAMLLNSAQGSDFQSMTFNKGLSEILESLKIKIRICAIESGKYSWLKQAQLPESK